VSQARIVECAAQTLGAVSADRRQITTLSGAFSNGMLYIAGRAQTNMTGSIQSLQFTPLTGPSVGANGYFWHGFLGQLNATDLTSLRFWATDPQFPSEISALLPDGNGNIIFGAFRYSTSTATTSNFTGGLQSFPCINHATVERAL
jgi:hypothetical protein